MCIAQRQAAARWQQGQGLPLAARGVLEVLEEHGELSVPQIGRLKTTSRQNIQILVNRLLAEGYVEKKSNPAHRRSGLVSLTEKGGEVLSQELPGEREVLSLISEEVSEQDLLQAIGTLRRLQTKLRQAGRAVEVLAGQSDAESRVGTGPKLQAEDEQAPDQGVSDTSTIQMEEGLPVSLL